MNKFRINYLLAFSLIQVTFGQEVVESNPEKVDRHIQINPDYGVSWTILDDTKEIVFKIVARYSGRNSYIGFGISINGAMDGSDIIIIKNIGPGFTIEDRHGVGNVEPELDASHNDWNLLSGWTNRTHFSAKISRLLNTGDDKEDVEITVDTLRLIWAVGEYDLLTQRLSYHKNDRGIISVNFLDPDVETPTPEELEKKYEVWKIEKTVQVSSNDTVYMCSFFKGPNVTSKHHMVGFGMYIDLPENKRHLHHADLYRCTAPPGTNPDEFFAPYLGDGYDCNYSPVRFPYENCGTFEFQWTIGGQITLFPDNLGLPLGRDDGATEYFMTEVHFNNEEKRSDLNIRAGFNIYHTPELRPTEIGQLQLGFMTNKTFSLTVPPNATNFVVSSHCPMDCTKNLPEDGINIFTYLLHSHLSGRRLKLRHYRGNYELPMLAKDDHFDFNYQNNRRLRTPVKILPGDHLTIECIYDSNWRRGGITLGGRSPREEMCQAFLLYWPRIDDVNSCGSYHSQKEILEFMGINDVYQYQGEIDATVTSPEHLSGLKYTDIVEHRVNWSTELRAKYQHLVQYGEQQAYCIPIESHNEPFVKTMYPKLVKVDDSFITVPDLVIFIAVTIIIVVTVIFVTIYVINAMRKRRKTSCSKDEIVK